jgi:hypothetical protein
MKILPEFFSSYSVGLFIERRPLLKRSRNGVVSRATRLWDVQLRNRSSMDQTGVQCNAGTCNLYLLKGHILMAERFAGRILVLQSKGWILLQDMPTNISVHRHT